MGRKGSNNLREGERQREQRDREGERQRGLREIERERQLRELRDRQVVDRQTDMRIEL